MSDSRLLSNEASLSSSDSLDSFYNYVKLKSYDEKTKYYQKLERSKFDEIFKEFVDSLAKDECYLEYIRDQFKTLFVDNMQPNNNLYQDVVVIYQKLTKNSDPEKFFS